MSFKALFLTLTLLLPVQLTLSSSPSFALAQNETVEDDEFVDLEDIEDDVPTEDDFEDEEYPDETVEDDYPDEPLEESEEEFDEDFQNDVEDETSDETFPDEDAPEDDFADEPIEESKDNLDHDLADEDFAFLYGDVTAIDENTLYIDDIPIALTDENRFIARFLTPGMFIEAIGNWHNNDFNADTFEVFEPEFWSYFEGPASLITQKNDNSNIRIWHSDDETIKEWQDENSDEITIVAFYDGSSFVHGYDFLPTLSLAEDSWYLLEGIVEDDGIVWTVIHTLF